MLLAALLAAFAFLAFFVLGKKRSRAKKSATTARDPLRDLVEEQVVVMVADGLALDAEALYGSLRGAPEADVVSAIEKGVAEVELVFERRPGARARFGSISRSKSRSRRAGAIAASRR